MAIIKNIVAPESIRTDVLAVFRNYYQLTKPKVVALLVLTAWVGMMLASPSPPS